MIENLDRKLKWFNGNQDALLVYQWFAHMLHTWDDLIDKDKEVTERQINDMMLMALVYLPSNKFYASIQQQILPMWMNVVTSYEAANQYEQNKDEHGIELSHTLRYAVGQIVAYMITVCSGRDKSAIYIPEMWKAVACERFDEYKKEHLNG